MLWHSVVVQYQMTDLAEMAKITVFSFLAVLFMPVVIRSESDEIEVAHVYANVESNISLPCMPQSSYNEPYSFPVAKDSLFVWIREGKALQHSKVDPSGVLFLSKIAKTDSGIYTCQMEKSIPHSDHTYTTIISRVQLHIKSNLPESLTYTFLPYFNIISKYFSNPPISCRNACLPLISSGLSYMAVEWHRRLSHTIYHCYLSRNDR